MTAAVSSETIRPRGPGSVGILACLAVGLLLVAIEGDVRWLPVPIIALTAGGVLGRILGGRAKEGAAAASTHFLRAGIVLLGLRLSLAQLGDIGARAGLVIVPCVAFAAVATWWLARTANIPTRLSLLLAAGTAVCGNSAIAAIAPSLQASDDEVAAAITTVTAYGTLALLLFPLVAVWVDLSPEAFGIWAGTAINDTSQVLASAFSVSDDAGEAATVVKLARNLFIIPAVAVAAWVGPRVAPARSARVRTALPWFVLAFVGAVVVASIVEVPASVESASSTVSKVLILTALAGIGIRAASLKVDRRLIVPLASGSLAGLSLALVSLTLVFLTT